MSHTPDSKVFGRRTPQHTIIIASGDRIRHFSVRPRMAAAVAGAVTLLLLTYLAATCYLVFRDDLIDVATARQSRVERAYEDRIAALRAQVDRVTSRNLIDHDTIEREVQALYARQLALSERHARLLPLLRRAQTAGLLAPAAPLPTPRPEPSSPQQARSETTAGTAIEAALAPTDNTRADASAATPLQSAFVEASAPAATGSSDKTATAADTPADPDAIVGVVATSLRSVEGDQDAKVETLTRTAEKAASRIEAVIRSTGVAVRDTGGDIPATTNDGHAADGVGGPFIPLADPAAFDQSLDRLDTALDKLESVRRVARKLPFGQPLAVDIVTSPFGARSDPFLEGEAFHPGVDLRAEDDSPVHATGAGTVTIAGWVNGYGNLVEIDHGNGIATRYGHLSRILVRKGDHVDYDAIVGRSGSTGRSTGPHLHYEVRLDNQPVNPMRFLDDGLKLTMLLRG